VTVAVGRPTWQSHLARLVDQITGKGYLQSSQWREALLAIPPTCSSRTTTCNALTDRDQGGLA
jgi:hypothetical protein